MSKTHRGLESIVHKIGLNVLLGWVLFLPITAYSLGLGDIDVKSFLNQPLRAEISIISARPGEIDDLLVGLASRKAFERASLARPSHLNNLKFKVIKSEDGTTAYISLKTQTAVKEPVLNFLVEADWAKGKVFREFTILLDPPYFAQQLATRPQTNNQTASLAAQQPVTTPSVNNRTVKQPAPIVEQTPEPVTSVASGYNNASAQDDEYRYNEATLDSAPMPAEEVSSNGQETISIADGATLWSVAKTLKTNDVSMSQIMLALQRLNQDAFGRNNINNLKQGSVLRVPTIQEMSALSRDEAYAEVLEQNGLWNEYLASAGQASVNTGNTQRNINQTTRGNTPDETNESSLAIVTAGEGDSDRAALRSDEDVAQISNLKKQLLLSEEEIESVRVERDELLSRVKMLEAELEKRNELDNLVNIEDNSLATMERELAKANDVLAEQEETQPEKQEEILGANQEQMAEQGMAESTAISEEGIEETVETASESMLEEQQQMPMNEMAEVEPTAVAESGIIVEEVNQAPAPIIVSEPSASSSLMDSIIQAVLNNPLVQGGIAVVLLLALLAVRFFKGREAKETEPKTSESIEDSVSDDPIDTQSGIIIPNVDDEDETPINVPQMEENQPVENFESTVASAQPLDEEDEFSKTAVIGPDEMATLEADASELSGGETEVVDEEQDETLDEVDVYLAYSLFENAEELLKEKLEESPDRADYRAKLLDTYFATQNKEAFVDEANSLKDLGASAEKYWPKVQTMGFELDPDNPMFAGGEGGDISELAIAKPEVADFDIGASEDDAAISDFDLSLDGDDTDFDLSEDNVDKDVPEDADLEFNLDESLDTEKADMAELPDELGDLDFDLDESSDTDTSADNVENESIDDEEALEFDLSDADLDFSTNTEDDETVKTDLNEELGDELDISLDDIEPEIDVNDEVLDEADISSDDIELNIGDLDEDLVELDLNEHSDDLSVEVDEDDEDIDFDETLTLDSADGTLKVDETVAMDSFEAADETVAMSSVEDVADDVSDDITTFDETTELASFDGVDKTAVMSTLDDIEETAVVSGLADQAEETEIVPILEDDELLSPESDADDDKLLIPDAKIELDDFDDEDITDIGNIEGLMLPDDVDEVATKLDLAKAFHDMGDSEGARSSLEEVLQDGNEAQKAEAQALLKEISD